MISREPGGSPGAEAIRKLLLEGDERRWNPRAEALLFAAARSDHVEKTIQPALERGDLGAERPLPRQQPGLSGGGRADWGSTRCATCIASASQDFLPDRTLVLQLDEHEAGARARTRDGNAGDRIGSRPPSYHAAVDAGFRIMAAREPDAGQAGRCLGPGGHRDRALALCARRSAAMIQGHDRAVDRSSSPPGAAVRCIMPGC